MNISSHLRKSAVALVLSFLLIPFSRVISPCAIIDGHPQFLAYLPLSVLVVMLLLFGRYAIIPLIVALAFWYTLFLSLTPVQLLAFILSAMLPVILCGLFCKGIIGPRWRYMLQGKGVGSRLFWLGFVSPCLLKVLLCASGAYIDYPPPLGRLFGDGSVMYDIIDLLNLIAASLLFSVLFYYPLRMILSPAFARGFWWRCIMPVLTPEKRLFSPAWFIALILLLIVFCWPYKGPLLSCFMVPVMFVLFTVGVFQFGPRLIILLWSLAAWLLLTFNQGFLYGLNSETSLSFILSVFISFTVCIFFMTAIFHKNEWMKHRYRSMALADPLTGLPNLRALEQHLQQEPAGALCCIRLTNLDFLSRHYGLLMRIHCKKTVTQLLKSLLQPQEKIFYLPACEMVLWLNGSMPEARLRHMVDLLNSKRLHWHNSQLEIEYGAAWTPLSENRHDIYRLIGQLSFLAEQATLSEPVLTLHENEPGQTTITAEPVMLLHTIKRALKEGGLKLYAQPVMNAQGKGYHEILSRLLCDGQLIMPDKFIPIIAQFNLSAMFDMQVLSALLRYLRKRPQPGHQPRFSVNLMPMTLMQKGSAQRIITLFRRHRVPFSAVILEVTEEQAFSSSESSMYNIAQLHESGFRIAIDDFGTGYANYARLKRLRADIIKIDGCFVKDIATDPADALIVKSICELAKAKSLSVVAEYVETEAQRELLQGLGVDYLQGYLLGKPQPLSLVAC